MGVGNMWRSLRNYLWACAKMYRNPIDRMAEECGTHLRINFGTVTKYQPVYMSCLAKEGDIAGNIAAARAVYREFESKF